ISVDDILEFEAQHGDIEPGTFDALRTDWSKWSPDREAFNNADADGNNQIPGWGLDALKLLFEERDINAVGHETFDTDSAIDFRKNGALLGEYYVLEQDTFQVELLKNLDKLPTISAVIFNIVPNSDKESGLPVKSFSLL